MDAPRLIVVGRRGARELNAVQRDRLQRVGFDMLLQEDTPTRESQKALTHLLARLRDADEVCLCSLEVLQLPAADLILVLQRFQTAGNRLKG